MTKTISKVGNSQGIIFDAALMDLARVKVGDQLNVTLHEGGSIILTPVRPTIALCGVKKRMNERCAAGACLWADQFSNGAFGKATADRLIEKK